MKAFKVVYYNGHFYNVESETKERIIPIQGCEYQIIGGDSNFGESVENNGCPEPLESEKKQKLIKDKYGDSKCLKILDKGQKIAFRIGNSKIKKGDSSHEYIFIGELLEDLYLFLIQSGKPTNPKDWRMVECQCKIDKCYQDKIKYFTPIYAESLNKLFTNTVMHYFSNQRSGSTNCFDSFFMYEDGMNIIYQSATYSHYETVGKVRKSKLKEFLLKMSKSNE